MEKLKNDDVFNFINSLNPFVRQKIKFLFHPLLNGNNNTSIYIANENTLYIPKEIEIKFIIEFHFSKIKLMIDSINFIWK